MTLVEQSAINVVKQLVALSKAGNFSDDAITPLLKTLDKPAINMLLEAIEISLATKYMSRKLLKKDRYGWNLVKHRRGQVLAMAA